MLCRIARLTRDRWRGRLAQDLRTDIETSGHAVSSMALTVAKGRPVELTSHSSTLMEMEMDPSAQSSEPDEDLYTRLKTLQRQLEFYEIQVFDRNVCHMICHQRTHTSFVTFTFCLLCMYLGDSKVTLVVVFSHLGTYCRRSTSKKSSVA